MLYDAYEVQRSFLAGASKWAGLGAGWLNNPSNPWGYSSAGPIVAASLEVFAHASAPRGKPEFGIHDARVGRKDVPVDEEILLRKPFGQLKHFAKVVRAVAPNASGGPVSIVEAGKTIVDAFREAGILSLVAIMILLFAVLRRFIDVVYTVLPVMLTGLLTLGTCVVIGQPISSSEPV